MKIAVIGGTGLLRFADALDWREIADAQVDTPYGEVSARPELASLGEVDVVFLARHGQPHRIAPHLINYRANLWLLKELGVEAAIASYAVGGIASDLNISDLVIPNQIIDYTWGRAHTFANAHDLQHVDFSEPFDADLRRRLIEAASRCALRSQLHFKGVYGCTQGPRLESAAEVDRLDRDGCTVIGMTAMPEAALARELDIDFAGVCLVVNPAAGRGSISSGGIREAVDRGAGDLTKLLLAFLDGADEID